jgi:hypothetical protein
MGAAGTSLSPLPCQAWHGMRFTNAHRVEVEVGADGPPKLRRRRAKKPAKYVNARKIQITNPWALFYLSRNIYNHGKLSVWISYPDYPVLMVLIVLLSSLTILQYMQTSFNVPIVLMPHNKPACYSTTFAATTGFAELHFMTATLNSPCHFGKHFFDPCKHNKMCQAHIIHKLMA